MYFESIADLWSMAGHGVYVWSCYGISLAVLSTMVILPLRQYRKQLDQIRRQHQANQN